jgi:hypothetical protein
LDVTLAAEKKFLILAYKNMVQSTTCDISDDVIDKFEGTYETYTKEEYRSSVKKEQNDDETASIVSSTYSNTSDLISIANSPIHKTTTKTTEVFLVKHEQQQKQRTKKSTKIRRRARNRVQLEPGEIPTTHPLMACKREGCAGNMTLLGDVKNHAETLEECQERAKLKFKLYPQTFFHGSSMTCMECGDRPRVGTHGRNASWQRLCRICGEAYAMNGFWRSTFVFVVSLTHHTHTHTQRTQVMEDITIKTLHPHFTCVPQFTRVISERSGNMKRSNR